MKVKQLKALAKKKVDIALRSRLRLQKLKGLKRGIIKIGKHEAW